jgi:AcrR family transcriptional regulator
MDAVASEAGVGKATIYRRWRTKTELVADAVVALADEVTVLPDGGSLEADLRALMSWLVDAVNGPLGAATRSLLSSMAHEPQLKAAFHGGPMEHWQATFHQVWARAEERGEVRPGLAGTAVAATASAAILQRWLFGVEPVDRAFADEVLADVVLPLVNATCPLQR